MVSAVWYRSAAEITERHAARRATSSRPDDPQRQRVSRRHENCAHDGAHPQGVPEPEAEREERRVPGRKDDPQALALGARQEEPAAYRRGGLADGEAQVPLGERLALGANNWLRRSTRGPPRK